MKHLAIMNFDLSPSQRDLLAQAEKACLAIRPTEDHAYLNHSLNDKTVGILAKYNLLGVPIDEKYGGMGADSAAPLLFAKKRRPDAHTARASGYEERARNTVSRTLLLL